MGENTLAASPEVPQVAEEMNPDLLDPEVEAVEDSGAGAAVAALVEDPENSEIPSPQNAKKSTLNAHLITKEQQQVNIMLVHNFPKIRK